MSDLVKELSEVTGPEIQKTMGNLAADYLNGFADMLENSGNVAALVETHLRKAADYKFKAVSAEDARIRRQYAEAMGDELASAATILKSEKARFSDDQAKTFIVGFEKVLATVGLVAKTVITTVVSGVAAGAVRGLVGGVAPDVSTFLPGA